MTCSYLTNFNELTQNASGSTKSGPGTLSSIPIQLYILYISLSVDLIINIIYIECHVGPVLMLPI